MRRVIMISCLTIAISLPITSMTFSAEKPFSVMTNSIGMKLVLLPAGEFQMGRPGSGKGRNRPQHRVRITKPFWMGIYEVTQEEYEAAKCINISSYRDPDMPVQNVFFKLAVEFCERLSRMEKVTYRLPTEAEWEYACRANTGDMYATGQLANYAWYKGNSGMKLHLVGQKKPNAWGLHDMHGNVWEWCSDKYSASYYRKSPLQDPQGPVRETDRVFVCGAWDSYASGCSAFYRYRLNPMIFFVVGGDVGFRVVRECR